MDFKLLKPADFERRSKVGEIYLRVDLNTVSLSTQLGIEMNLQKGNFLGFAQFGDDIYVCQVNTDKEGFALRGNSKNGLQFSFGSFVQFLLKHYGLLDLLKSSGEFKCHKFTLLKVEESGITYYKLESPKKYEAVPSANGRKEAVPA